MVKEKKPLKYKYICLCGGIVWSDKDNLQIHCDNHYDMKTMIRFIKMKTMGMVAKQEKILKRKGNKFL